MQKVRVTREVPPGACSHRIPVGTTGYLTKAGATATADANCGETAVRFNWSQFAGHEVLKMMERDLWLVYYWVPTKDLELV